MPPRNMRSKVSAMAPRALVGCHMGAYVPPRTDAREAYLAFAAVLSDRGAISVSGEDAAHFLHNLVTSSVDALLPGTAAYAGLLTPQGKIIADFLVLRTADGYLLDVPAGRIEELKKRLTLYRLRAKVT